MKTAARRATKKTRPGTAHRPCKRIVVVDDHPITRHGLVQLIKATRGLEVVGEAEDARTTLALIAREKPDLLVADLGLADKSGLDLIKDVRALHPDVAVLVLSMHDETLYAERVLRAGGRGYIMKREGGARFLEAVHRVLDGQIYLSEAIATPLMEILSGQTPRGGRSPLGQLTDREFDVFQLLGQGMTTREIAQRLNVGTKTVDTHRQNIREKLRLRSTPELVKYAVRWTTTAQTV